MANRWHRGFSLWEILVVMLVIAILLGLLMPAIHSSWAVAQQTQCMSNLARLGQAIGVRASEETQGLRPPLQPRAWPGQVLPYLENRTEILCCPLGDAYTNKYWSEVAPQETVAGSSGGTSQSKPKPKSSWISEFVEVREITPSGTFYEPMAAGPFVLKMSDEQWQEARSRNLLGNLDDANYIDTQHPEYRTYQAGANPDVYWLCFEDHGGDQDFKDVMMKVHHQADDTYVLHIISGYTGHRDSLVTKLDHQELIYIGSENPGFDFVLVKTEEGSDSGDATDMPANIGTPTTTTAAPRIVGYVATGYALNAGNPTMAGRPGRILMLDYCGYLAQTTDSCWESDIPAFARHWGGVNVLFTDGSVRLLYPEEIDPRTPSNQVRYWDP